MNKPKKVSLQNRFYKNTAFTLLEFSIVLLIIALLIVGIVGGQKLVELANLSKARSLTNSSAVNKIQGLALWVESTSKKSFSSEEPADGEFIDSWKDINPQSKIKKNGTVIGSSRPTYILKAINGLPAISFDGIDDYLFFQTESDWKFLHDGSEHTYFIVFKTASSDPNSFMLPLGSSIADLNGVGMDFVIEDRASQSANQQVWMASINGLPRTVYEIHSPNNSVDLSKANFATASYKARLKGDNAKLFVNGTEVASGKTGATPTNKDSNFPLCIGGAPLGYPMSGYIGEIIIFKKLLSNFERGEVDKYLSKKWGIKLN